MDTKALHDLIEISLLNPSLLQRRVHEGAESILQGEYNVVNATNPYAYLVEVNCATAAAVATNHGDLITLIYPQHANDQETLYRFMSDRAYVGRFATPSSAPFRMAIRKEEILARAVQVGTSKVKKLVIPRNTRVKVAGVDFGFQYPIEIRILPHGGLQIVYNVDKLSPLETLTSNVVDWKLVDSPAGEFVIIDVVLQQFTLDHRTEVLNSATGFVKRYDFVDNYYHCRVFHSYDAVNWVEMQTTHSQQVYNPTKVTAALRVVNNQLRVEIPQIYFSTGLVRSNLRVDIYTTKGPLSMALEGLPLHEFVTSWYDYDNDDNGIYTAPLSLIAEFTVFSEGGTSGGTAEIDFETFRDRVVSNGQTTGDEISPAQLEVALGKKGYGVVKNIDQITDRIYLATRSLPNPQKNQIVSGANCCINLLNSKIEDLVLHDTVVDNTGRVTLLPSTLYKFSDGVVQLCSNQERRSLLGYVNSNPDLLANTVNQNDYIYSPFHYVLDMTQEFFACRGYYLEASKIDGRRFIAENETAEVEIASGAYDLRRTEYGWDLFVVTRSGKSYQDLKDNQVFCQMAIQPVGESSLAYLNGELVAMQEKERVWRFQIETNYDVDHLHSLSLTNFRMFGNSPSTVAVKLGVDFEIFHIVSPDAVPATFEKSSTDALIGDEILPPGVVAVVHERLTVHLGSELKNLWSNARTVVTEEDYVRYQENVPAYWEENEYERDAATGAINWTVKADGTLEAKLLHAKGDPVVLDDGTPVWKYQVGEVKLVDGKPVLKDPRGLARHVELFFLEGSLYFATDGADLEYRNSLAGNVVEFLEKDIAKFSRSALERTELFYYPPRTLGQTKAIVRDGVVDWIPSSLSFNLRFYLGATQYNNMALRDPQAATAKRVIANALTRSEFSLSQVNDEIREALGSDRVPIDIEPLGAKKDLTTFTLYDDSSRCGVRHRLKVLADNTLQLEDDITIEWVRHREN